jgi:hypothetical protein
LTLQVHKYKLDKKDCCSKICRNFARSYIQVVFAYWGKTVSMRLGPNLGGPHIFITYGHPEYKADLVKNDYFFDKKIKLLFYQWIIEIDQHECNTGVGLGCRSMETPL